MLDYLRNKQPYIFRPTQLVRRVMRPSASVDGHGIATLPWRLPIRYVRGDPIGSSIERMGLYDLLVSESLARLADPGETCVDAGANIGHMTSILAWRVGATGTVHAFEPHPEVVQLLRSNAEDWMSRPEIGRITIHEAALSDASGTGALAAGPGFETNRGTASLAPAGAGSVTYPVDLVMLDEVATEDVGVLKIDVEGHELSVLHGASRLMAEGRLRDVIFEEHGRYPSPVTDALEGSGFELWSLGVGLGGPVLRTPSWTPPEGYDARSYLATIDSNRAQTRFSSRGWVCLRR